MGIKRRHMYAIAALAALAALFYFAGSSFTGYFGIGSTASAMDTFARCLTEKGVVMYGSTYCGHCANQKAMFGDSFQYMTYVECTEQQELCQQKGIQGVPAWEINGKFYVGEQSLGTLSLLSGCQQE